MQMLVLSGMVMMTSLLVAGQRPFFAGSRPIGFPETPNRTTTVDPLGDRFGEGTTERLPIEANGDRDLIDRLSKLPLDKQPFWFINWQALEQHRKTPQTYPQKPNVFVDPIPQTPNNIGVISRFSSPDPSSVTDAVNVFNRIVPTTDQPNVGVFSNNQPNGGHVESNNQPSGIRVDSNNKPSGIRVESNNHQNNIRVDSNNHQNNIRVDSNNQQNSIRVDSNNQANSIRVDSNNQQNHSNSNVVTTSNNGMVTKNFFYQTSSSFASQHFFASSSRYPEFYSQTDTNQKGQDFYK